MSSSSDFTISNINVDTGFKPWAPRTFTKDDKFWYCLGAIAADPRIEIAMKNKSQAGDEQLSQEPKLKTAEQKLIERSFVDFALKKDGVVPFAHVTKTRYLIKANEDVTAPQSFGEKYCAIVVAWKGEGYPPDVLNAKLGCAEETLSLAIEAMNLEQQNVHTVDTLYNTKFTRVHHHGDDKTEDGSPFHWTRMEFHNQDHAYASGDALQKKWQELSNESGNTDFYLYQVPLCLKSEEVNLKDIVGNRDEFLCPEKNYWREILRALLQKEFKDNKNIVVHGQKYFDLFHDPSMTTSGLRFVIGKDRQITFSAQAVPYPILTEYPTEKLFIEPLSIAQFLDKQSSSSFMHLGHKGLADILCGKSVRFSPGMGSETRPIYTISRQLFGEIEDHKIHPAFRGKPGIRFRSSQYLSIDVGSPFKPAIVPAEGCYFLPGQTFKHPGKLAVPLSEYHSEANVVSQGGLPIDEVAFHLKSSDTREEVLHGLNEQIASMIYNGGEVVFLDAGVSTGYSIFSSFRETVEHELEVLVPLGRKFDSIPTLSLEYEPSRDPSRDLIRLWTRQLKNFRKAHKLQKKTVFAVVAIRNDEYSSEIYKAVKTVCDIDVGFQTFFVKLNVLEQKVASNPENGLAGAAHEVIHRMALRNVPAPGALTAEEKLDLVIAVHIMEQVVNEPKIDDQGRCISKTSKKYIASFVSRLATESKGYASGVLEIDEDDIHKYEPCSQLGEFIRNVTGHKDGVPGARVTVLRTGYLPVPRNSPSKLAEENAKPLVKVERKEIHRRVNVRDSSSYNVGKPETPPPELPEVWTESMLLEREYEACKSAVQFDTRHLSYVFLSQDTNFVMSEQTKQKINAEVTKQTAGDRTQHSFFITDTSAMNSGQNVIRSHRQVDPRGNASLIKLVVLGDDLEPEEKPSQEEVRKNDVRPAAHHRKDDRKDGHPDGQSEGQTMNQQDNQSSEQDSDSYRGRQPDASDPQDKPRKDSLSPIKRLAKMSDDIASGNYDLQDAKVTFPILVTREYPISSPSPTSASFDPRLGPIGKGTTFVGGVSERPGVFTVPAQATQQHQKRLEEETAKDSEAMTEWSAGLRAAPVRSRVKEDLLRRLAHMWEDDRLDLHNTKWPVPTHLAYLAAKRALFHLRFWEKKDGGDEDDEDSAGCTLPQVHEKIKDTLYFL